MVGTATFRLRYAFLTIKHGSRRLVDVSVTANPNSAWTLQQLREVMSSESPYPFLFHERDRIFAEHLDQSITTLGASVLKLPSLADGQFHL